MADRIGYGVDIGQYSIKFVELRRAKGGIRLARARIVETRITPTMGKEERDTATADALNEILREAGIGKTGSVTIATPGLSAFIRYVKLPPVTSKRLQQIIGYEAQQQVPFPLDEVTWNYQILESKGKTETSIILVAIKSEVVDTLLSMTGSQGLEPSIIEHRPLGLYNCVVSNEETEKGETTVIIDIGARATDLSIEREGELCWTRSARIGGGDITEAIAKELQITFEEAEKLKVEKGVVYLSPDEEKSADETGKRMWEVTHPVLQELTTELQRSISYFHSQLEGGRIDKILITGGCTRLRNFDRLLTEQLGAEVKMLDPLSKIEYSPETLEDEGLKSELGVAIGLALRSLGEGFSKINLLPKIVVSRRELQKKKVYLVLSGLSLGLILAVSATFAIENRNVTEVHLKNISDELKKYDQYETEIEKLIGEQNKIRGKVDILRKLAADREYWPSILLEFSRVLPDNVYLARLATVAGNTIELRGRTPNFDAVTNLIARLEQSPSFDNVEVVSAVHVEGSAATKRESGTGRRRSRRGTSGVEKASPGESDSTAGIDFVLRVRLVR